MGQTIAAVSASAPNWAGIARFASNAAGGVGERFAGVFSAAARSNAQARYTASLRALADTIAVRPMAMMWLAQPSGRHRDGLLAIARFASSQARSGGQVAPASTVRVAAPPTSAEYRIVGLSVRGPDPARAAALDAQLDREGISKADIIRRQNRLQEILTSTVRVAAPPTSSVRVGGPVAAVRLAAPPVAAISNTGNSEALLAQVRAELQKPREQWHRDLVQIVSAVEAAKASPEASIAMLKRLLSSTTGDARLMLAVQIVSIEQGLAMMQAMQSMMSSAPSQPMAPASSEPMAPSNLTPGRSVLSTLGPTADNVIRGESSPAAVSVGNYTY